MLIETARTETKRVPFGISSKNELKAAKSVKEKKVKPAMVPIQEEKTT